jgi:pre-mRNA 3'-end-processing factor FIP1
LIADDSKDGNEESNQDGMDDSDDDDDDDINVVIGDIKSGGPSAYVKGQTDGKQKQPGSKFNIEEFESVGTINGQPAFEFAVESIEDKPWRKPGADITDYFSE